MITRIFIQVNLFGGSAWTWNDERQAYYLHQFAPQQPDLNFENEDLVEEMKVRYIFRRYCKCIGMNNGYLRNNWIPFDSMRRTLWGFGWTAASMVLGSTLLRIYLKIWGFWTSHWAELPTIPTTINIPNEYTRKICPKLMTWFNNGTKL